MPTLVENNEPKINFEVLNGGGSEPKRRAQLLIALAMLFAALALVVVRNWEFWLSALNLEEASRQTTSDAIKIDKTGIPATVRKGSARPASGSAIPAPALMFAAPDVPILAPLQVDVTYASGEHQTLVARNSAVHIDLQSSSQPASEGSGDQVRFSPQTAEVVVHRVEPVYPPLAQEEHVQGSVVLRARIDKDGNVQDVQVLSGPAILTGAALEAVRQWRFKPHFEGDHAAPTETRITVNFTISTQ